MTVCQKDIGTGWQSNLDVVCGHQAYTAIIKVAHLKPALKLTMRGPGPAIACDPWVASIFIKNKNQGFSNWETRQTWIIVQPLKSNKYADNVPVWRNFFDERKPLAGLEAQLSTSTTVEISNWNIDLRIDTIRIIISVPNNTRGPDDETIEQAFMSNFEDSFNHF